MTDTEFLAPTIDAIFDATLAGATREMEKNNFVHPHFVARLPDGHLMMIRCSGDAMASIQTKLMLAMIVRRQFRKDAVTHYSYVSEIWISSNLTPEEHLRRYSPSRRDDRFEGLLLIAGDHQRTDCRAYFTQRDGERFKRFVPKKETSPFIGEEWFHNLLQPHPHPAVYRWLHALAETLILD